MRYLLSICIIIVFITGCNTNSGNSPETATTDQSVNQKYTGPIIDMHLHANYENGMFGLTHPPTLRGETYEGVKDGAEQRDQTLKKFEEHNIVMAMITDGKAWQEYTDTKILVGLDEQVAIAELRERHAAGEMDVMAEMAPFYGGLLANDPRLDAHFALAAELDIPVGYHIFPGGPNGGYHLMPEMLSGMRSYNASPFQLEDVVVKYPNLRIYIMHGAWPHIDDLKALLYAHPNVYVDVAVVNWIMPEEEQFTYLRELINAGFGDRIMYGTDQMVWPQTITIGIETINNADFLTLEQKEDIFFNNAATFLRLSEEEINTLKASLN